MSLETRIVKHACHRCNAEFDMTETYVEGLKMWVSSGGLCPTCGATYGREALNALSSRWLGEQRAFGATLSYKY